MTNLFKLLLISYAVNRYNNGQDTPQLIESRGFQSKSYTVRTSDGYILTMFRIINPYWTGKTKKPILLQHGYVENSDLWFQNTPGMLYSNFTYIEETGVTTDCSALNASAVGNTIPFVLSVCGYDVWLGNNRGTKYSTGHVKYDVTKDSEYWNFNVDTLMNDIIAEINLIKRETKSDTIRYIGHSLGNTQMLQLLSENEELNKIIKPLIALAPVMYGGNLDLRYKAMAAFEPVLRLVNGPYGVAYFLPPNKLKVVDKIQRKVCLLPIIKNLCQAIMMAIGGSNYRDNKLKYYPDRMGIFPDDSSFKVAAHLSQRIIFNTFSKYDYRSGNLAHYGRLTPPKYDLSKITNEYIIFVSGQNDLLAPPRDVDQARRDLKVQLYEDYVVPDSRYGHFDFLWANNLGKLVNSKILTWLNE